MVGRADDSTVLLILGEGEERSGHKLRDASERGIPCTDVRTPGRFTSAVLAGEFVGGDPLPEPAQVDRSGMSDRERNRVIRTWARENGWPNLPAQGRVPMQVHHAYELAHRDASEGKAAAV
ncbi:Lsr2 family protein [Streptomyces sp. A1499]|uniref:Lsr2 family protein n=1 Tax=Streptomyces sp. A1499 TaxID=2563104 RepID=UPI000ACB242D|nr:Lsr2 family protein [Streptomyces sp. A1499]